jgi:5-methylcytosine-specific restriction enzyme subunit McrC
MFVFRLVDQLLAGTGLHQHYQRGDRSIIVNASTNEPYARVVPDLLVEANDPTVAGRVAVDAKYKLYDQRKLDSGDVYQSFLYAYAFSGAGAHAVPAALLLYPSSMRSSQAVRLRVRTAQTSADAEILALGFSIPEALAEVTHGVRGPVTQTIIEAIQQGMGSRTVVA